MRVVIVACTISCSVQRSTCAAFPIVEDEFAGKKVVATRRPCSNRSSNHCLCVKFSKGDVTDSLHYYKPVSFRTQVVGMPGNIAWVGVPDSLSHHKDKSFMLFQAN